MKSNKPDISLIRKYLNGELDAAAMYQMERQAQDDPMLMDVMMGMEMGDNQDDVHLAEIRQRIKNRVGKKRSVKLIPWKTWTVAASLIFAVGFIAFFILDKPQEVQFANQRSEDIKQKIKYIKRDTLVSSEENKSVDQRINIINPTLAARRKKKIQHARAVEIEPATSIAALAREDSVIYKGDALNEVAIVGYGTQKRSSITGSISTVNRSAVEQSSVQDMLAGRVAGLSMAKREKKASSQKLEEKSVNYKLMIRGTSSLNPSQKPLYIVDGLPYAGDINTLDPNLISSMEVLKDASATAIYGARAANGVIIIKSKTPAIVIHGIIRDGESKQPLPGAAVYVKDSGKATYTDKDGKFSLVAPSKSEKIEVSMIGYEKGQAKTKGADSLMIALLPSNQSLNEVVVGYGTIKREKPQPFIGWKAYDDYLEEEATSIDDKEGRVTLAFTIAPDGTPSNFKVVKSDNDAMSKKAIELIKTGPKWNPGKGMNGKEIKLKIKFH